MLNYYARNGDEITLEQYFQLFRDQGYKVVEQTEVEPYMISTVWLGLDHRFGSDGPPVIFETMVFAMDGWEHIEGGLLHELDCVRYCTEEEARAGHAAMVTLVQATTPDIPDTPETLEKEENG